jgi:hypothetical protein
MYLNLNKTPQWVLNKSHFLKTLYENRDIDNDNDTNSLTYIPFLDKYDVNYDFSKLFKNDEEYINLELFLSIYFDGLLFLDFINFEIEFYKLIEPNDYRNNTELLRDSNIYNHFCENIKGLQLFSFNIDLNNNLNVMSFDYSFKKCFKESMELDQYDWILWILNSGHLFNNNFNYNYYNFNFIFDNDFYDFDFTNLSLKTFNLLHHFNYIFQDQQHNIFYTNIYKNIIKYRKIYIFTEYLDLIKNSNNGNGNNNDIDNIILKNAFKRNINESLMSHFEFVKMILNCGFKFNFEYYYAKYTYYSYNYILMEYMYNNYTVISNSYVDICSVLNKLSLKTEYCNYDEKVSIIDFFYKYYNNLVYIEKLINNIYNITNKRNCLTLNSYNNSDINIMLYIIEKFNKKYNIYSLYLYLYYNLDDCINDYINFIKYILENDIEIEPWNEDEIDINNMIDTGNISVANAANADDDISAIEIKIDAKIINIKRRYFKNSFKYVLLFKKYEYIDFYIENKLYSEDSENDYLEYVINNITIFKKIYYNIKNSNNVLNDELFMSAYESRSLQVILFMFENNYVPSYYIKKNIDSDYNNMIEINKVAENNNIHIIKYYNNEEFIFVERVYNIIYN